MACAGSRARCVDLAEPHLFWLGRASARPRSRRRRASRSPGSLPALAESSRGSHRAGHRSVLLCENDPGALAVLGARFPDVPLKDVRLLAALPRETGLLAAGFPCQDLSQAGLTKGIQGSRSGLIGEVFQRSGANGSRGCCSRTFPSCFNSGEVALST